MNNAARWQKTALSILCVVLALVLIVMVFATVYIHYLLSLVGKAPGHDDTLSSEQMATATESLDPNYTGPIVDPTDVTISTLPPDRLPTGNHQDVVNILLVGQDREKDQSRQRSDSMILVTFDQKDKTITMTSFMRDTYVHIPGHQKNKLNAAYQWGGFKLLNETLAVNFGVHVDANVEVDFSAFEKVIDLLGGVEIELTRSEARYINQKLKADRVKEGWNTLDGAEALWYARNRTNTTLDGNKNDFGRTERQRRVITALITKYKNQSLGTMLGLLEDILPMLTTDLSSTEILSYAVDLFPMLSKAKLQSLRIPTDDTYYDEKQIGNVGDVLVPDLETIRQILNEAGVTNS